MSHRLTNEELDEQFELFLKESVSDDSVDFGRLEKWTSAKSSKKSSTKKPTVSWWQDEDHSDGGSRRETTKSRFIKTRKPQPKSDEGLQESGKTFRKSQSIQEENEDPGGSGLKVGEFKDADDTELVPAVNTTSLGLDTLEEEQEKARFFSQLEAGASSMIDYSRLNRELDSMSSTDGANIRKAEEDMEQSDDNQRKAKVIEAIRESSGSPHYSDDFEEEEKGKEPHEEKSKMSPILAKVSLYDSLEDTGGDGGGKNGVGSLDRGQPYVQSGGSEMEALHEAYRQIHKVEDSDDHQPSIERRGRINRTVSPSPPPPHHVGQSLQPASTTESELPTAEELMRPIRPETDHVRGFTLQPVSALEQNREQPHFLERTFPDVTSPELIMKDSEVADHAQGKYRAKGPSSQPLGSPDSPNINLTWSIRQEVERLMKDQNKHGTSSQFSRAKKQTVSLGSTFSYSPSTSVKKPAAAPARGWRVEGRTAVTSRSAGTSRAAAAAAAKTSSNVSRPLQHAQGKTKVPKSKEKENFPDPGLRVSSELVSSVQSLVNVLKQQIDTSHERAAEAQEVYEETRLMHYSQKNNRDDEEQRHLLEDLRAQLAQREQELQVMKDKAEEISALRQQNFLLQSKLRGEEEASQRKRSAETAADSAAGERLQHMEKEIKEQETLIKGYQQENEKLYSQLKAQQARGKANEEAMFNENQTLLNQLAFTRDQLSKHSRPVGNVCLMDHTRRITDLLAQIETFEKNEAKLCEDIHRLKQEKEALEVDLQLMKRERNLAKTQATSSSDDRTLELHALEEKHREEVTALKKKLQWFAENQELLDRDAGRLKAATAEIYQLKEQVENLKTEVSKRSSEQQRKAREKTADTKRMRDLEKQVKELEQILRHRNPNSLPALIYAAASAGGPEDKNVDKTSPPSRINTLLERRIQRLEAELESHDEEAKRSLRAMEQQFHRIKLRYEQQISDLEQQLEQKQQQKEAQTETRTSQVQTLEEELQRVKENHQEKEKSLQDQIESLQKQLKHKVQPSPSRHQRQTEAAFGVRIDRLNQELATKTRTIQELSHTVERLQKERRNMLPGPKPRPRPETRPAETRLQQGPAKTQSSAPAAVMCGEEETFPAAQYEKMYQPTVFAGSHISEVVQENEDLKQELERLQLQSERDREELKADAAKAREELSRLQENSAEQLSSLKAEHLRVLDQLRAAHALEYSASEVAKLTNKVLTQEIMLRHQQEQLRELQEAKDALMISRTREDVLQKQLTRLLQELKEAKEAQSPEVKLLCSLEKKIFNMELRHQHREKELQQVITHSWQTLNTSQHSEVERWKHLAQEKCREIDAFRVELDSILDILRHLQRQGVTLTPISAITAPNTAQTS
ncbi:centrosomal protein of 162 kDa isoform X2 [Cheilinus undulatus]|uniref:centrosomal protein of 162 kDa isoform X2 n=1 Tax=Cheilinus undulatus TaxID=241271 RepID=UPI001BD4C047|nr:centrosomal protein of 162 kDa isoform X2 [Cheilinus undulatus]